MFFFKRLGKVLIQLICISVAIYARPEKGVSLNNGLRPDTSPDSVDITRYLITYVLTFLLHLQLLSWYRINHNELYLIRVYQSSDNFRYCFEIASLLGAIEFLIIQQGEEIKNSGMKSFLKNLVEKTISIVISALIGKFTYEYVLR